MRGAPSRSSADLDAIILDDGIGEKLLGRGLERGFGTSAVDPFDLDIEDLALTHTRHATDSKRFQSAFDGLALRIEDAGFKGDGDARFHALSIGMNRKPRNM